MNRKEWQEYIQTMYILHLTVGGSDETFPKVLENIGVCTVCIRNKKRCTCVEVKA